jgi:hypothetical protein
MSFLSRFKGRDDSQDIPGPDTFDLTNAWEISPPPSPTEYPHYIQSLSIVLPDNATLYLVASSPSPDAVRFFEISFSVQPIIKKSLLSRSFVFLFPSSQYYLQKLSNLISNHEYNEICDNIHAFLGQEALMTWYDAFFAEPIMLSVTISEEKIRSFCEKISASYNKI